MSPLVRSLLAFAALLATAHGYCNTRKVGVTQPCTYPTNYQPIDFTPPGVSVQIPDYYCPAGMRVVGEEITACNHDPYGPAPRIDGPPSGLWSPGDVTCSYNQEYPQCPRGGRVYIKQCCEYYGGH